MRNPSVPPRLFGNHTSAICFFLTFLASVLVQIAACFLAIMAALPEAGVAATTAAYSSVRCFGYIWDIIIPSVIFNDLINKNIERISDPSMRLNLAHGGAYSLASQMHNLKDTIPEEVLADIKDFYVASLKPLWWVACSLSFVGYLSVWFERQLELRQELEIEYGLHDK